ncbi:hypothetical protein BJ322DRAFT_1169024 [Thelephora terrestris]|uniref:F-box domain-containing protein n=1 Tax=Thelephora terrestris TaxID=56493 RepID=A0A9P6HMM3_9AGAM|nr:hypothetical protein BJ322DRAFT_1169024 [Thelephora terrestris]
MSDNHNLSPHIQLPPEFWEDVILELNAVEALRLRVLNRAFCSLVDGSLRIQCKIELFALGLESGTRNNLLGPVDQRAALERYRKRREHLEHAERVSLNVDRRRMRILLLEPLIIYQPAGKDKRDHHILRIPSPSKGLPRKEWIICGLPGGRFDCAAVQPAHDLVVMVATISSGTLSQLQDLKAYFSLAFYFVDDYRLAILRRSELSARDTSLVMYDTRGEPHPALEVPQLILRLPEGASAASFCGPGEAPNHDDVLFTPIREQSLLAIRMETPDPSSVTTFFLVVTVEKLFELAAGDPERMMEFDEWERVAHKLQIPSPLERGVIAVWVCGPTILVVEPDVLPARDKLWACDFSPYARRTNLASGRQQKYTLQHYNFQVQEAVGSDNRRSVLPEGFIVDRTRPGSGECVLRVMAL